MQTGLKQIGTLIGELREMRGLTQQDLAKAIRTTQSAVARMERGEQNLSTQMLGKIGTALKKEIVTLSRGNMSFRIEGGHSLSGSIDVNSSKNGAVALLAASLLNKGTTVLKHMPRIEEVHRLIEVLQSIGVSIVWKDHTVEIRPPKQFSLSSINVSAAKKN